MRLFDNAGSTDSIASAFYVKKDTAAPVVRNFQEGDDTWQKFGGSFYNVDFIDFGAGLAGAKYFAYTGPGKTGDPKAEVVIPGVNGSTFTANWEVDFGLLAQGTNYISVEVYDLLGSTVAQNDVFYVLKDEIGPAISNYQQGGDVQWRNSSGTVYSLLFEDLNSKVATIEYRITNQSQSAVYKDWTIISSDTAGFSSYSQGWPVDFSALYSGVTSYVSVRSYDKAGNMSKIDNAFFILKDTSAPSISPNPPDAYYGHYSTAPGNIFDMDFYDEGGSKLSYLQYKISTDTAQGGTLVKDWTTIKLNVSATFYNENWGVDFYSLMKDPATNYVSVRAYDIAGSSKVYEDAFRIFRSSSATPMIARKQVDDTQWFTVNTAVYDMDFTTNSEVSLSSFSVQACANSGQQNVLIGWTTVQINLNTGYYADDWSLPEEFFNGLKSGINYISLRVDDSSAPPNSAVFQDVFIVKKDTSPPEFLKNQAGDDVWRSAAGTVYNVGFRDLASGLTTAQYTIRSSPDMGGTVLKNWTNLFTSQSGSSTFSEAWQADFDSLRQGNTNYISVKAFDIAGLMDVSTDVFHIRIDTTQPLITDMQADATHYLSANTGLYKVYFEDPGGGAGLVKFQVRASTTGVSEGQFITDWTDVVNPVNQQAYNQDWQMPSDFWAQLMSGPTNYISVRVFDNALPQNSTHTLNIFTVRKDTAPPYLQNSFIPDNNWRETDPGAVYNVYFHDLESMVTTIQYAVYPSSNMAGSPIKGWTNITASTLTYHYTENWGVDFSIIPEGIRYVSARVFDGVGLSSTSADVFYVKKDTSAPEITNRQAGDGSWRNGPGAAYNVDFKDLASGLTTIQYKVTTGKAEGGQLVRDWTDITASPAGLNLYDEDWQIDFSTLTESATNYVSARAFDLTGKTSAYQDVFYVLKDVTLPGISNQQTGDDAWRNSSGTVYKVYFNDGGGSKLNKFQVKITSGPSGTGTLILDWADYAVNIASNGYAQDWALTSQQWSLLPQGRSYVSVRAYDNASNYQSLLGAFYIQKDTSPPSIENHQSGDNVWRNSNLTAYDVRFADTGGSKLAKFQVKPSTNQSGAPYLTDWTDAVLSINATFYSMPWNLPVSVWDGLQPSASNFISVRVFDNAGSSYAIANAFFVLKDTSAPRISNAQSGDNTWRKSNNGAYKVYFSDTGGSLLSRFQARVSTIAYGAEPFLFDWSDIQTSISSVNYSNDWQFLSGQWPMFAPGTNYISVRVYDNSQSTDTLDNAFYVLKDTQNPSAGALASPYSNSLNFNIAYSSSDAGDSGVEYVKLYYAYNTVSPYSWGQFGSTFNSSPIAFTASQSGTAGFKIIAYDRAGNQDETAPPSLDTAPESVTVVDLSAPQISTNTQSGDSIWRNSSGTVYNANFTAVGGSMLDTAQYRVTSDSAGTAVIKDWTNISTGINSANYDTDWSVDFASLKSSYNYVSARAWNLAGTTVTETGLFYVKKDTQAPVFENNEYGGVNIWRNADAGATYDVYFADNLSLLSKVQYSASSAAFSASGGVMGWTDIQTSISSSSYNVPWSVLFNPLLPDVTNYVSVRAFDIAGNIAVSADVFYVLKDTVTPEIQGTQSGDNQWQSVYGKTYDVDFADSGGSLLDTAQYTAYTSTGRVSGLKVNWTNISSNISSTNYKIDWAIGSGQWALLAEATNYISVRVWDRAGSTTTADDRFYILKDASGPQILKNQSGDNIWRSVNNGAYSAGFEDNLSGLSKFEVQATTGGAGAAVIRDWTFAQNLSGKSYSTPWNLPQIVFDSMVEGINYVSVRAYDPVVNVSTETDAFYVKKDTTGPDITDSQDDDNTWRKDNAAAYKIYFSDNISLISKFQLKASTGAWHTGSQSFDWSDAVTGINSASYTQDWQIPADLWTLLAPGTNYISVSAFDIAGASSTKTDAFYMLKDTVAPSAVTGLSAGTGNEGEITLSWTAPGDNENSGGKITSYMVKISSAGAINSGNFDSAQTYAQNWTISNPGESQNTTITGLNAGVQYWVAVKSIDKAGNVSIISNAPSAVSGADTTLPGQIADLAAQTGAFEGQINLSWTAPGDNGVSVGTCTAYLVRYRTDQAITSTALWESPQTQVLSQSWQPLGAGGQENRTIDGLDPGTTYYWAVRGRDEVPWAGALSNSPSAMAQKAGAVGGVLQYGVGAGNVPYWRKWTPPNFETGQTGIATNASGSSIVRHVIARAGVSRNEKMAGVLSSDGVLQIQRYNGNANNWTNEWSTTTIGASNSAYRGFDIAYEQNSGRAMVLYQGVSAGELYYNIYDGSSWTGAVSLTTGAAAAAIWIRLEPKKNSNELMAVMAKSGNTLYAVRWSSISWRDGIQLTAGLGGTVKQNFDAAWETSGGECMVSYFGGTTGRADTQIWNGLSWYTPGTNFAFTGGDRTAQWIKLAADPGSDKIGAAAVDSGNDWNSSIWDGSQWAYQAAENGTVGNINNQARSIDAIWESQSGKFMVVSAHSSSYGVLFSTWANGVWGTTLAAAQTIGAWSNTVNGLQLESDPNTNSILLTGFSASNDLRSAAWNGGSWSIIENPHTANISANGYMPFMLAFHRHDASPPTVADDQSGDDSWRNSNAGLYDININDAGGSGIKEIQAKACSGPNQTGTIVDWSMQVATSGVNSYTDNWMLALSTWNALQEGMNYISVRAKDGAGNITAGPKIDAFYVKKDTTSPSIPGLVLPADLASVNTLTPYFDWLNSTETISGLANYSVQVSTSQDFAALAYSANPAVSESTAAALISQKYWWRAQAKDNADNFSSFSSTYAVFVDTVIPLVQNPVAGDNAWRSLNPGGVYRADFTDSGSSELFSAEYSIYSSTGRTGNQIVSFGDGLIAGNVNSNSYADLWPISAENWALLQNGTNYISLRAADNAGNSQILEDAFYIRKDVSAPGYTNNQQGDDIWRNAAGAVYKLYFSDTGGSMLSKFKVKITSGPLGTGTIISDWTDKITEINSDSYNSDWDIGVSTWNLMPEGTSYVSAMAYDWAGNTATVLGAFYVRKDTTAPSLPQLLSPADAKILSVSNPFFDWQDSTDTKSGVYNYSISIATSADFAVLVSSADYAVSQFTASNLGSALYYWKVKAKDNAGNFSDFTSTFSVRIDTALPVIQNFQSGDNNWRRADPGRIFNVDFKDPAGGSMLDTIEYAVFTGPNQTGDNPIYWAIISSGNPVESYTDNWGVNFSLLASGTNYISARVWDIAGSTAAQNDVFYVRKDDIPPSVNDNQSGDDAWRSSSGTVYKVYFSDTGGSKLSKFQVKITTGPGETGSLVSDWADRVTGINSNSYNTDWELGNTLWNLLKPATNYISVMVYDTAGSTYTRLDAFYVLKDTVPPSINDQQDGDDSWRNSSGAVYDVRFNDSGGSGLSYFQIKVTTGQNETGAVIAGWTTIISAINATYYVLPWSVPENVFNAMQSGKNYVSVRVYDEAGLSDLKQDAFYVKKSTISPRIINRQSGDSSWRRESGTVYNVDFEDDGASGLHTAQYKIITASGALAKDWWNIAFINAPSYVTDWPVDFSAVVENTTNYISARAWDIAGATSTLSNAFYILKDVTAPTIFRDNQPQADSWRNANTGMYDVDFNDSGGSKLSYFQLKVTTGANQTGAVISDWAVRQSNISSNSYITDWSLETSTFNAMQEGRNYVSARVFDNAGNQTSLNDVFYVRKDTTAPSVPGQTVPADKSTAKTLAVFFDWPDSSDAPSGSGIYGYETVISTLESMGITASSAVTVSSQFNASLSMSATHYWRVRAKDNADNFSQWSSTFSVLVDTVAPLIANYQTAPPSWIKTDAGAVYNVDFADPLSKLHTVQYSVWTGPVQTGTNTVAWAIISSGSAAAFYDADWSVNFSLLEPGTNYISVRAWDLAGSTAVVYDAFKVLKDTFAPSIINNEAGGDNIWRSANPGAVYEVYFRDNLSGLATAQYTVNSAAGFAGTELVPWKDFAVGINSAEYNSQWGFTGGDWDLIPQGTSYVSVRIIDRLGQYTTGQDMLYIRKDTAQPQAAGYPVYIPLARMQSDVSAIAVSFSDEGGSLLSHSSYTAWSQAGRTGGKIIDWTNITSGISSASYSIPWPVNFSALPNFATSYISAAIYDNSGNQRIENDVAVIYKDASGPQITNSQSGDDVWRSTNTGAYKVRFQSQSGSNLDKFMARASTSASGGVFNPDWTDAVANIGALSYTADWPLPYSAFSVMEPGKNYISMQVFDLVPSSSILQNGFYVLKDTVPARIVDSQNEDAQWHSSSGTVYSVNFYDELSGLATIQYRITAESGQNGQEITGWTNIAQPPVNQPSYTAGWEVNFAGLKESVTNYVSVRACDTLLQWTTTNDVFYVLKDTTPPSSVSLSSPDDGAFYNTQSVSLDWQDSSDTRSGVTEYEMHISTKSDFSTVSYSSNPVVSSVSADSLIEGLHYWRLRAIDNADNYSSWSATRSFYVDTSSPVISVYQQTPTQWYLADPGAVFDVDFADLATGLTTAEYRISSGPAGAGLIKDWTFIGTWPSGTADYTGLWSVDFSTMIGGNNYISVRAFDRVGLSSAVVDAFIVRKDTGGPEIIDMQDDDEWRNVSGTAYNVDFRDLNAGLATAQYKITLSPAGEGTVKKDWYNIFASPGISLHDENWTVDFFSLEEAATNYVSVRVYDVLGSSSVKYDAFKVFKDVTNPSVVNNQSEDNAWHNLDPGAVYNVRFADSGGSKLNKAQYMVSSSSLTPSGDVKSWTDIASGIGSDSYSDLWGVDFSTLPEGVNYVSAKALDFAGNPAQENNVFFVNKDTTPPHITDNQGGDDTWRSLNNGAYNVSFADSGGSLLSRFQIKATSGPAGTGTVFFDWSDDKTGISSTSYGPGWSFSQETWDMLPSGTSYISIMVYDNAGSTDIVYGSFYVRKDTNTLSVNGWQPAGWDGVWRSSNTGSYMADASAQGGALLDRIQVRASTMPGNSGPFLIDWTDSVSGINSSAYSAYWSLPWQVFDALLSGASNYLSVKVVNQAQGFVVQADAFIVRKDSAAPFIDNPLAGGDLAWRNSSGTYYNIGFSDYGGSMLSGFEVKAGTNSGGAGPLLFDWTAVSGSINSQSYSTAWQLPSGKLELLAEAVTNYISIRAYDTAGSTSVFTDAFKIFKDTTPVSIKDYQSGDDAWKNSSGTAYNVDFTDSGGSLIKKFQIRASTQSAGGPSLLFDWSDAVTGISTDSYTMDWKPAESQWTQLAPGPNYISIRAEDYAGNISVSQSPPFYIKKDTVAPSFVNDEEGGDPVWRKSGRPYSVRFRDGVSQLNVLQYSVSTTASSLDGNVVGWTDISLNVSSTFYDAPWNVTFGSLRENATNYVSARAWDYASSTGTLADAFKIFMDTTPPSINDQQADDGIWRKANTGLYKIYFSDTGGSKLSKFQIKASTGPLETGTVKVNWTDNAVISGDSYSSDWALSSTVWNSLEDSATNYISVRVFDSAGSTDTKIDAFAVIKDTTPPAIRDWQADDTAWRDLNPGAIYDVDFEDFGSRVSSAAYAAWNASVKGGTQTINWTQIFTSTGYSSYTAPWEIYFSSAEPGYNYITVKVYDIAGNWSELADVFYIKKDTAVPYITDLQAGDTNWYRLNPGNIFNIDFADAGVGVSSAVYAAWKNPGQGAPNLISGTTIFTGSPVASYLTNWGLTEPDWMLLQPGINYMTVTAWDGLAHSSASADVFYIRKDTVAPSAINNLAAVTPSGAVNEGNLQINWSAPGDDDLTGQTSYYMIRYKTGSNFSGPADFDSASVYVSTLIPKAYGGSEGLLTSGFSPGVTYYIAVEAVDKAGNQAGLSNTAGNFSYAGPDISTPSAIADLFASTGDFKGQIALRWTAPGEGIAGIASSGTVSSYIVRYATFQITSGNFSAPDVSTYTQTWQPQPYGNFQSYVMSGLSPGTSYYTAVKAVDEAGNTGDISNVALATATPAGAADGMSLYGESVSNTPKYRSWSPPNWGAQDNAFQTGSTIRWIALKSVPVAANQKIAGVLSSDNNLKFIKWNGQPPQAWSDITPSPSPTPGGSAYRNFDIAPEESAGRIMVVYYNGTPGYVTYAVWSSSASQWSVSPVSMSLPSLSGAINWVKLKSMPGTNKIGLMVLDSASRISAAVWNGSAWIDGVNLSASASIATRECFDGSWETLTGNYVTMWGSATVTTPLYKIWRATGTWDSSTGTGPNINGTLNWLRLASDPSSNRIGLTAIDSVPGWSVSIWRLAGSETWSASPAKDTSMSGAGTRISDAAWEGKSGRFMAVAVDNLGAVDNKFDYITWTSAGGWSPVSPSVAGPNNNTVFAGNITWLSLVSDPNTDDITALGIDSSKKLKSTVWTNYAWVASESPSNFEHDSDVSDPNYECAGIAFNRHDSVPPSVTDNQSGDDIWRNASGLYAVSAADSGGSKLARIETRVYKGAGLQTANAVQSDWTPQVTGINSDLYDTNWPLTQTTFDLIPQEQACYVSVRSIDNVGNESDPVYDAFYVKKDTTAPAITSQHSAGFDGAWHNSSGAVYNVDFADTGGSNLSTMEYSAWTQPLRTGTNTITWTLISSGAPVSSFDTNWAINFALLEPGTNYISARAWDYAGTTTMSTDTFKVLKDTHVPSAIADLSASTGQVRGTVVLTWTAPGDNGVFVDNFSGSYVVRYAASPITSEELFNSAADYIQNWQPHPAGTQESRVIYGLPPGINYYFAVKARDKAGNTSAISNSANSYPQTGNVFVNEVYPSGDGASQDWIELLNNTVSTFNLTGWTLVYNQGTIDEPNTESIVWTGVSGDTIAPNGRFTKSPSINLNSVMSYHVILKDAAGNAIDRVQWPSLPAGRSFARINDGNADYFEIDPAPTKGYSNSVSTDPVKINEAAYGAIADEFIELYNTSQDTITLSGYSLRNSSGVKFRFLRKIYAAGYTGFDSSSMGMDAVPYAAAFGDEGLNSAGDYLVLENPSGETIDRVTWQSSGNYPLYDYKALSASLITPAPAFASGSIGRSSSEGMDTDVDSNDFISSNTTPGSRNNGAGSVDANALIYPSDSQILPRKFKIELAISSNSAAGTADTLWFIRTGGSADAYSPHIYRLSDIGFNLTSLSVQTTVQSGLEMYDQDGNQLVGGAVYKLIFNSDTETGSAPQIIRTGVVYDTSIHSVSAHNTAPFRINEGAQDDLIRLEVDNNSPAGRNAVEIERIKVKFMDENLQPLTIFQAQDLFERIGIVADSTNGIAGVYEPVNDNAWISSVLNEDISLDANGEQIFNVPFPDSNSASIPAASTAAYFVVAETAYASGDAVPNVFRAGLKPDTAMTLRDGPSDIAQTLASSFHVDSSSSYVIVPATPPAGTSWPYAPPEGASAGVETTAGSYIDYYGVNPTVYYVGGIDGKMRAITDSGTSKWIFPTDPLSAIRSAPLVEDDGGTVYVYFGNDAGRLYKLRDDPDSGYKMWERNLSNPIRSGIIMSGAKLYVGSNNSKVYCMNKSDGLDCTGWTFDPGITANISGTPSVDDTAGVHASWVGLEDGKVVHLRNADGVLNPSLQTGGPIKSSPYVDSGWYGASNNIYVTSTDKKLYSRTSENLTTLPSNWTDFTASSPIYTTPFIQDMQGGRYVYFGDDSGTLYKVDASSGGLVWTFKAGGSIRSSPVPVPAAYMGLDNDYVYFGCDDGYIYALKDEGETVSLRSGWPVATGGAVRADTVIDIDEMTLTVGSADGKTYTLYIGP